MRVGLVDRVGSGRRGRRDVGVDTGQITNAGRDGFEGAFGAGQAGASVGDLVHVA